MVIDNSASMYFPTDDMSKINFATYSAACIAYMLKKQRDAVGLSILNDEIVFQIILFKFGQIQTRTTILKALAAIPPIVLGLYD